ncbi:general secretion pathway protein J [gamma proteobacterium HTCC5015]|nr:general secretion pathway protein J [gamma proteobacterium HTCC5015]
MRLPNILLGTEAVATKHCKRPQNGFTLIEILVAIAVIAVLYLIVFGVIGEATQSREKVSDYGERLTDLQRSFVLLEQDISQIIDRTARDAYGAEHPALRNESQGMEVALGLTRGGWPNPAGLPLSNTARVEYHLRPSEEESEEGEALFDLYRVYWRPPDSASREPDRERRLLQRVRAFEVRYLDMDRQWQEDWPPLNQTAAGLPRALEVRIDLAPFGEIKRLFRVVEAHGV